jgi:NAD(P)-dependent dehydrogenase (short-subunit alcohol dehydrogenase family)
MRLAGKTAIVTGAASGFGSETARLFATEGAAVVVGDVDSGRGQDVVDSIRDAGGRAELSVVDVGTAAGAEALAGVAREAFGAVDVLVNNAGISQKGLGFTWDMDEDDWDRVIRVDLKSVFLCSRAVIPAMIERGGGSIVSVASIAASRAVGGAAYAAAKGGILSYTRQVSRELASRNIRLNCVSPGFMRTPMTTGERDGLDEAQQEERLAAFGQRVPMKRCGTTSDIAAAILFLACDESSYVTGQEVVVDGGYLAG